MRMLMKETSFCLDDVAVVFFALWGPKKNERKTRREKDNHHRHPTRPHDFDVRVTPTSSVHDEAYSNIFPFLPVKNASLCV